MGIWAEHIGAFGRAAALAGLIALAAPLQALDANPQVQALNALTLLPETLEVITLEGLAQGEDLGADLTGDGKDPDWAMALQRVYDSGRMQRIYDEALAAFLAQEPGLLAEVTPFLGSDLGARVIALELEARRTALDPAAKDAARQLLDQIRGEDPDRMALLERLVLAGDLIESNVISGLNGNVAFLRAMAGASAGAPPFNESEVLAQVWQNEPQLRAEIEDFLYPLMALAYAPLSDAEVRDYVLFTESAAGKTFNAALTAAFGALMLDLAAHLGHEAGRAASGQAL